MKIIYSLFIILLISACGKTAQHWEQESGIDVSRNGTLCDNKAVEHRLMDIRLSGNNDSVIFTTYSKPRKFELSFGQLDSSQGMVKVIRNTCLGDSFEAKVSANDFYVGLGGAVPSTLKNETMLNLKIKVLDDLNQGQYSAYKQAFEQRSIQNFVKRFNWKTTIDSATLIWYEYLLQNKTSRVNIKKSKINYVIKTINDIPIARNKIGDPLTFDSNDKNILLGIQFLASRLDVNEKVRALLPSSMAFGPDGNSQVPPYTPIVIELDCVEVIE